MAGGSSAPIPAAPRPEPAVLTTAGDLERVQVETEDKQVLICSLYPPRRRGSDELAPGAILIHDAGGSRQQLEELAERMQKQGFCVLVPDLRGHGESIAPDLDYGREDSLGRERLWAFAARDIKACAAYLHDLEGVHSTNLSLIGHRAGAVLATRHAVRDENVRGLILIEPVIERVEGEPNLALTMDDLRKLGGLPTFVTVSKNQHTRAQRLCNAAMRANDGGEFIEISVSRCKPSQILEDRRLPSLTSKWMMEQAIPKRGR
jgi:alpha-beta hydrolase superfamily lysophospholipase